MPVIVVEGPEKAGKSTFIERLKLLLGPATQVRHHAAVSPVPGQPLDARYSAELQVDLDSPAKYTIYDRAWASDHVYDRLLGRETSRLAYDQFLGEWMYSRAVATTGVRVMLLGPSDAHLYARRTADDHSIQPHIERAAFQQYAEAWNWDRCVRTPTDPAALDALAASVVALAQRRTLDMLDLRLGPPTYVGPAWPRVLFVDEIRNGINLVQGSFLPFSSYYATKFGRSLGPLALHCGWASPIAVTDKLLSRARLIVTCGAGARERTAEFLQRGQSRPQVMDIHHPSWLYKWGEAAGLVAPTEVRVRRAVFQRLGIQEVA